MKLTPDELELIIIALANELLRLLVQPDARYRKDIVALLSRIDEHKNLWADEVVKAALEHLSS